jgi:hypothetical protein
MNGGPPVEIWKWGLENGVECSDVDDNDDNGEEDNNEGDNDSDDDDDPFQGWGAEYGNPPPR